MRKVGTVLGVYLSFLIILLAISFVFPTTGPGIWQPIWFAFVWCGSVSFGLTFLWFQIKPLSK